MSDNEPAVHRIFVVEDHPAMRAALIRLLQRQRDFLICGEAASVAEALWRIPPAAPDLVMVDVSLPEANGLELVEQMRQAQPEISFLVISGHEESSFAAAALQAGARGYVMKKNTEAIIAAARRVLGGEVYLSEEMQERIA